MKVGVTQLNSNDSTTDNFSQIKKLIEESKSRSPEILFFPENSIYFRIDSKRPIEPVDFSGDIVKELAVLARQNSVALHLTSAFKLDSRVYNATLMIDENGKTDVVYKKMHLFDIELLGQKPIRESDSFEHGTGPSVTQFKNFKLGHSICYDVRFAELYSSYAKSQVDLILVPAAFLVKTGQAHWEILLRARAIESQCYVIASAQSGVHKSVVDGQIRETFGHSMIVDPWGQIVAVKQDGVGIIYADIDLNEIRKVRAQIPMQAHRRNVF